MVAVILPFRRCCIARCLFNILFLGEIYWSDTGQGVIQKADLNFGVAMVVSDGLEMADGLVVDSVGRKVHSSDLTANLTKSFFFFIAVNKLKVFN